MILLTITKCSISDVTAVARLERINSLTFWSKVINHELCGEKPFVSISNYALAVHSLPVSNSYVERIFSIISFFKDKYSNRMGLPMLNALLIIKTHLQENLFIFLKKRIFPYYFDQRSRNSIFCLRFMNLYIPYIPTIIP